jgi:hypothetical protein
MVKMWKEVVVTCIVHGGVRKIMAEIPTGHIPYKSQKLYSPSQFARHMRVLLALI